LSLVFLIEDETPLIRLIGWYLVDDGYQVAVLRDPDEILRRLPNERPIAIVCNSNMPPAEKADRFAQWRALVPGVPILDVEERLGAPPSSADAVLYLPMHADDLLSELRRVISERR
jgi:DNA-binding response OmpR family regulator